MNRPPAPDPSAVASATVPPNDRAPAEPPIASAGPTARDERIDLVDALRGFALLGILLVNIDYFAQPLAAEFLEIELWPAAHDRIADVLVSFFAESKFYSLFATLFGFGMAMQMGRAQQRGDAFVSRYVRRLLVLLGFAAAHVVLLWYGDILHAYALLGFALLLFRNCSQRALLGWSAGLLIAAIVLVAAASSLSALGQSLAPTAPATQPATAPAESFTAQQEPEDPLADAARTLMDWEIQAYAHGNYASQIVQRLMDFALSAGMTLFIYPNILGLFLFGVWLARAGVLHQPDAHASWLKHAMWIGLLLGVPLNALYAWTYSYGLASNNVFLAALAAPLALAAAPLLSLGYLSLLARTWTTARGRALLAWLAPVGRMALTNYLLQSLVCSLTFNSVGLGLFGTVGPAACLLIAVAIYAAQIAISPLWLAHFRFGPAEWLWRTLTYGKRLPMRIAATTEG